MVDIYIVSDNMELFQLLRGAEKYVGFFDNLNIINIPSLEGNINYNNLFILDKEKYIEDCEDILKHGACLLLCEDGNVDINIEKEYHIQMIRRPFNIDELYCVLKTSLGVCKSKGIVQDKQDMEQGSFLAAQTDYLTGLPNRRGLYEYFELIKNDENIHCMFLDIDNFKKVNDTYGHKIGDKLLVRVSHMVKTIIGEAFLARLSGDEFAVILKGELEKDKVIDIAQGILDSVAEIECSMDISSIISFSIGIILNQSVTNDLEDILLKSDVAMYQAKKSGKNKYIIYNSIEDQFAYKMSVNKEKRNALQSGNFKIFFRPRMNMITSGIEGAETRIFWDHEVDGLRNPKQFMDILEEDGFIVELEMYIFNQLCTIMKTWENTPLSKINVLFNMSKRHLMIGDFSNKLMRIVNQYGLNPERFFIGISEADTSDKANNNITALINAGFGISYRKSIGNIGVSLLDSSDNRASEWVIDQDLTRSMSDSRASATIIKSIISLAKDLNIQVVARGVEDKRITDYLSNYGCAIGVGDFFSEPLNPVNFYEYALSNFQICENTYVYDFNNGFTDQNGKNGARLIDEQSNGCIIEYCELLKKNILKFPGSMLPMDNTLELPVDVLRTKNYTVSLMVKSEKFNQWTSVFYTSYSNGFMSIMPCAWDNSVMFRVKDSLYLDEWHDAVGFELEENKWYYITATYNSKKMESRIYVNGELAGLREKVHLIEEPINIVVGGDVFTKSFVGSINKIQIHDYVLSVEEIVKEYKESFCI